MGNIDNLDVMAFFCLLLLGWGIILIYLDGEKK